MKKFLFRFEDSAILRKISLLAVFTFMFMGLGFSQQHLAAISSSPSSVESILRNHDLKSEKTLILPILKAEYADLEQQHLVSDLPELTLKMYLTAEVAKMVVDNVEIYSALSKSYVKLVNRSQDFSGSFDLDAMVGDLADLLD